MKDAIDNLYDTLGCLGGTIVAILCVLFIIALFFGIFCFEGWIFMMLWNWLAVELFSAQILSYWTCVGIVFALHFIGRLLFGRKSTNSTNN